MARVALTAILALAVSTALAQAPTTGPAPAAAGVLPRVLRHVPDDAGLVIVLPSITELSAGVAGFGKYVRIDALADLTPADLVEELVQGAGAGVDTEGPLVLAMIPAFEEPLIFAAAKNAEPYPAAAQARELRAGVRLYDFGADQHLAALSDGVLIFGRERADLRKALESSGRFAEDFVRTLGPALAQRQIGVWIDVPAWHDRLETGLALANRAISMGVTEAPSSDTDTEVALQLWNVMLAQARRTLKDEQTLVAAIRVDREGVFVEARVTFRPDTAAARYLKQAQPAHKPLLRGLPTADCNLIFAYEWQDAADTEGFNTVLTRAILNVPALRAKIGPEKVEVLLERSATVNRKITGSNVAFTFDPGNRGMLYWGFYLTEDSRTVQREMRGMFEQMPELMSAVGTMPGLMEPREAEEVAGTSADVYQYTFDASTSQPMPQPVIMAMYGKHPRLYMAPHTEGVAYTFGPREEARAKLAQILGGEAAATRDERVQRALRSVTPDPQGCVLFDLPELIKGVARLVEQLGLPIPPLELPATRGPLTVGGLYLRPERLSVELFLPADTIKALRDAVEGVGFRGRAADAAQ